MSLLDDLELDIENQRRATAPVFRRASDVVDLLSDPQRETPTSIALDMYIAYREPFCGGWVLWLSNHEVAHLTEEQRATLPGRSFAFKAKYLFKLSVWTNNPRRLEVAVTDIPDGSNIYVPRVTGLHLYQQVPRGQDSTNQPLPPTQDSPSRPLARAQGNANRIELVPVINVESDEEGDVESPANARSGEPPHEATVAVDHVAIQAASAAVSHESVDSDPDATESEEERGPVTNGASVADSPTQEDDADTFNALDTTSFTNVDGTHGTRRQPELEPVSVTESSNDSTSAKATLASTDLASASDNENGSSAGASVQVRASQDTASVTKTASDEMNGSITTRARKAATDEQKDRNIKKRRGV